MLKFKLKYEVFTSFPQVHEALNELLHFGKFETNRCEDGVCYSVDFMNHSILSLLMDAGAEIYDFIGAVEVPLTKLNEIVPEEFPCNVAKVETVETQVVDGEEIEVQNIKEVAIKWRDYAVCFEGATNAIIMIGRYDLGNKTCTPPDSELFYAFASLGNIITKSDVELWKELNIVKEETEVEL